MSRISLILVVFMLGLAASGAVQAHHAFAADYEAGNEGTISGRITEVIFRNPHARYYIEVTNDDGSTELWDLETMNLMALGRMGWKKDTIKVGDEVTVTGILGRNNTKRMSIVTVTLPTGRTISPFRSNRRTNVELNAGADDDGSSTGIRSEASNVSAGIYELDNNHAYLTFSYSHMGLSRPIIHFGDFDGRLILNGRDMSQSEVTIAIDASSVDTGVAELNESLLGEDYFAVAEHPEIVFRSTAFEPLTETTGVLRGELTVIGITKPAELSVRINDAAMNRQTRKEMIGFSATGTVRRSDFGLTAFSEYVGDELSLDVQVEFVRADVQPGSPGGRQ